MLGILIAMPVSGGHINPAVTLGLALLGRVQKRAVPVYFLGQFVGAFLGAAVVFGVYYDAIVKIDPYLTVLSVNGSTPTAGVFATYPGANLSMATVVLVFLTFFFELEHPQF